jgi:hypothetical protein
MDVDPSQIPVEPVPFGYGLLRFSQSLTRGQARVVAIGSSSTAGEGTVTPYPPRLETLLRQRYPNAGITVANKGKKGEEAPAELARFTTDVIALNPDLLIWQVGTNAVWQGPADKPPSFEETVTAIRDGLVRLRKETQADVIMMDLQYLPGMLTPAKKARSIQMVEAISALALEAGVNVFRRFAFMKGLVDVEQVAIDRMVNEADNDRFHQSDWVTFRVAWAMKLAIERGVDKATASGS